MRLIDAKEQADRITKSIIENRDIFIKILESKDNDYLFGLMIRYFDAQPTAYDVDKVLEQLEELPICSTWNHNSDNISRKSAIEIVRSGGLDE